MGAGRRMRYSQLSKCYHPRRLWGANSPKFVPRLGRIARTCGMKYLEEIDHRAPEFGDLYDELPLWSAPFGLMLLEQVQIRPGITILDVGAGTGFMTIELAQRCGSAAMVIAVDPWKAAIKRLARKVEHLGIENVHMVVRDVVAIDLPDASVDLIVSNLGINNYDDPHA